MDEQQLGDDTYIRKFGFRRFSGIRQTRLYRIIAVAWFNLLETIRRSSKSALFPIKSLDSSLSE